MSAMSNLHNDMVAAQTLMDSSTGDQIRDLENQIKRYRGWIDHQNDYIQTIETMLKNLILVCREGTVQEYFNEMEKIEEFLEISNG
jgi:hypothetical protein